jgi:hypothetical protein
MIPELQAAVRAMAGLLKQENEALLAMDFGRAGSLLAAKHSAADALAAAWRAAAEDIPQDDLTALGALADENRRLLNRAMRVQRRVLDLVARAARGTQPASRYGAAGQATPELAAPRRFRARI